MSIHSNKSLSTDRICKFSAIVGELLNRLVNLTVKSLVDRSCVAHIFFFSFYHVNNSRIPGVAAVEEEEAEEESRGL